MFLITSVVYLNTENKPFTFEGVKTAIYLA